MSDYSLIATRNSHAKHNKSVGRIPEHRQGRVAHQSHQMSSERRQKNCKNRNLHPVVMLNCSLIATRKSHAKHNKSVGRIPRGAEHRQAKDYYAKDYKLSCFGSEIKGRHSRNLTACTNTHDRLQVRNRSRTCKKIIKPLSIRWAPTKEELHIKVIQWVVKGGQINANIGTYFL